MSDNIKVERNDPRKKMVSVKNIEPISNIKIVRDHSDSDDSSDISDSTVDVPVKKTKKVMRRKADVNYQPTKDYTFLSNPKKISRHMQKEDIESEYSSEDDDSAASEEYDNASINSDSPNNTESYEEKQKIKQTLLFKIQALEKKGFEFSKKFNMTSNLEEMQFEYDKVKHFIESQAAIKFSRRCLMACVTGIEFLNKKFDPFSVKLEGWSENVMESVDDYDNIFERLHEKYSQKAEIAPEIELLLTLGGSAFMYHLTNSLLKSPSMGMVAQNNPNFMSSMMGAMSQGMKEMNKPPNFKQQPPQHGLAPPLETRGIRKEMRGPNIDPGLFSGTQLSSNRQEQHSVLTNDNLRNYYEESQIREDDRYSIASSGSSLSSVSVGSTVKKVKMNKNKLGGIELNIN